jgi:hypothetical protein
VISYPQVSPPKPCIHLFSPPPCFIPVYFILLDFIIRIIFGEEFWAVLRLEYSFIWCWNLDAAGSRSETPGKFWNVVLEEDGKGQLDWSCEKWRCIA